MSQIDTMKYTVSFTTLCLLFSTMLGSIPAYSAIPSVNRSNHSRYQNAIAFTDVLKREMREMMTISPDFESGLISYNSKQYSQAVYYFSQAIADHPNKAILHYWRGLIYTGHLGLYQYAINDLNIAIQLNSSLAEPWHYRGHAYYMMGYKSLAANDFTNAMSLFKEYNNVEWYNLSGGFLQRCYR
jgi:tetratricopeptide (TPR) repeat protein